MAAVAALAAAGGQAACAAGMDVVGGVQAVLGEPGVGQLLHVSAFEAGGLPYLLVLGYGEVHTINVTDPYHPVRAGGIHYTEFVGPWFEDADVFYAPDGRVYAAVTGGGLRILDVTDPSNVEMFGAPDGLHAFGLPCHIAILERPDGRIHALVEWGTPHTVDVTDPHHQIIVEEVQDVGPAYCGIDGAAFEPGDGRIYVVYAGHRTSSGPPDDGAGDQDNFTCRETRSTLGLK